MALTLKDRVLETTTTTGTGSISLGGTQTGYQAFSVIGNGNTTYYTIQGIDASGNPTGEWEVGLGTYTAAGNTLSRDTVYDSSNGGAKVVFSAGTKQVFCDLPAEQVSSGGGANYPVNTNITSMTGLTGGISNPNYIAFNTAYATTLATGQLGWDGNNTLGLGMAGGNVIQHIGEDQFFYIKASSAITKGQVCMFTGAVGASGVLTAAPATGATLDGLYIMGIAAETIALNGFGLIQCFGTLRQINTSAYADGDILYYDPTSTGGLTKVQPSKANTQVVVAAVSNAALNGSLAVRVTYLPELIDLQGLSISGSSNGQLITYDGTNGYYKNTTLTAGTGVSVTPSSTGVLTVTNTAPDQTVALTGAGTVTVTGTYPSFTITGASGAGVTNVTGTAPIASTGGATPNITITKATTSTDGYLSSTDWNTFNNKQPAGTYVTAITVASANGLTGSSSGGATPALTLGTSVTGLLKGNGTAISAATSGTDYAPATSGSSILYGNGAGGFSNVTVGSGLTFAGGTLSATGGGGVTLGLVSATAMGYNLQ